MNGSDITGCAAVKNLAIALKKQGVSFVLSNLKESFARAMFRTKLDQSILRQRTLLLDLGSCPGFGSRRRSGKGPCVGVEASAPYHYKEPRVAAYSDVRHGQGLQAGQKLFRFSASGTSQRNTAISVGSRTSRASKASRSSKAQELSELP